jgi:hypothetical protein
MEFGIFLLLLNRLNYRLDKWTIEPATPLVHSPIRFLNLGMSPECRQCWAWRNTREPPVVAKRSACGSTSADCRLPRADPARFANVGVNAVKQVRTLQHSYCPTLRNEARSSRARLGDGLPPLRNTFWQLYNPTPISRCISRMFSTQNWVSAGRYARHIHKAEKSDVMSRPVSDRQGWTRNQQMTNIYT